MKKSIYIIAGLLMVFSCSQKMELQNCRTENTPSKIVGSEAGSQAMLSFGTEEELYLTMEGLKSMTIEERQEWYSKCTGFVSQADFRWMAAEELENATSIEEARTIQNKYRPYLLFNDEPMEDGSYDISPYIPSDIMGIELVANKFGNVCVGGEIINYNNIESSTQSMHYRMNVMNQSSAGKYIKLASIHKATSTRKHWIEAYIDTNMGWIDLKLTAQKHIGLGMWNIYQTSYQLKFEEFENWEVVAPMARLIKASSDRGEYYSTGDLKADTYFNLASGVEGKNIFDRAVMVLSGKTRGIPEAGTLEVSASKEVSIIPVDPSIGIKDPVIIIK